MSGTLKRGMKTVVPSQKLRRRAVQHAQHKLYAAPEALDEVLAAELRERFEPEVAGLGAHLGRDLLSLWGYGTSR